MQSATLGPTPVNSQSFFLSFSVSKSSKLSSNFLETIEAFFTKYFDLYPSPMLLKNSSSFPFKLSSVKKAYSSLLNAVNFLPNNVERLSIARLIRGMLLF